MRCFFDLFLQDIDLKKTIDKQLADERFQIMELKSKVDTLSETNFKWNIDLDSDDKFLQEMEEESRILALQIAEARQKNEELNRKINQFDNRSSPLLNESESPALLAANKELEEYAFYFYALENLSIFQLKFDWTLFYFQVERTYGGNSAFEIYTWS